MKLSISVAESRHLTITTINFIHFVILFQIYPFFGSLRYLCPVRWGRIRSWASFSYSQWMQSFDQFACAPNKYTKSLPENVARRKP